MMLFVVAACVAISTYIVVNRLMPVAFRSLQDYSGKASLTTSSSLVEMFIFVDPRRIRYAVGIAWAVGLLLLWMISGSFIFGALGSVLFAFLPGFLVKYLKGKREQRFLFDLPDAMLGVSNMMKAGSNLTMALETIVTEMKGPISQEFGLFLRELRLGIAFDDALDNLQGRMPIDDLRLVVAGMKISREVGGGLADVLARLADTIRKRIEMEGKIRSLTAQGKMQGVVMSALPLFVGYLLFQIEPAAMGHLFSDYSGWAVCAVIVIGEYIGYRFIKKIVTIDI